MCVSSGNATRNVCQQEFPQSLPKLLQSISWSNRSEVAQVYHLLQKWRPISPESALELLDHQYADIQVSLGTCACAAVPVVYMVCVCYM